MARHRMRGAVSWRGGKGMGRAGDRSRGAAATAMRSRGLAVAVMAIMAVVALLQRGMLRGAHGEGGLERHADDEHHGDEDTAQLFHGRSILPQLLVPVSRVAGGVAAQIVVALDLVGGQEFPRAPVRIDCLLYTSDAAD